MTRAPLAIAIALLALTPAASAFAQQATADKPVAAPATAAAPPAAAVTVADEAAFLTDLKALTAAPHRLAGSSEGQKAVEYIEGRLREIGITDRYTLDTPVWQLRILRCQLTVGQATVDLLPMRANLTVPPATPPEGLSGPVLYVGKGETADYGDRSASGAIVVLDYDCLDNWQRAFTLGAKAVIFIGSPTATSVHPKHLGIPANLVRLYAPPEVLAKLDLRKDHPAGTVVSHLQWEQATARSVFAFLPGTDPIFDLERAKPEVLVLSADLDTFGQVPHATPGARGAANVALLLQTAAQFQLHRPRRDVVLAFLNGQASAYKGARYFYSTLAMDKDTEANLRQQHGEERTFVTSVLDLIQGDPESWAQSDLRRPALDVLQRDARYIHDDLRQRLLQARLAVRQGGPQAAAAKDAIQATVSQWDTVRRSLDRSNVEAIYRDQPEVWKELAAASAQRLTGRLDDLDRLLAADEQRARLRQRLLERWIALHVTYNFSDTGLAAATLPGTTAGYPVAGAQAAPTWGVVMGDALKGPKPGGEKSADEPGFYGAVLAAFRAASASLPPESGLDTETIKDPQAGRSAVPGPFAAGGKPAGTFGIYNVSLMTCNDLRARDGHPSDSIENLQGRPFLAQAEAAQILLSHLADSRALSLSRVFTDQSLIQLPQWESGKHVASGNFVGLRVTGGLREDRPASGGLLAIFQPLSGPDLPEVGCAWVETGPFNFDAVAVEAVDGNGRFPLMGLRKDHLNSYNALGVMFDPVGQVSAVTNQETLLVNSAGSARVSLVPATGGVLGPPPMGYRATGTLYVMQAAASARQRPDRSLCGHDNHFTFFYLFKYGGIRDVKIYHPFGPVFLNVTPAGPDGAGFPPDAFLTPPAENAQEAEDLWRLNENRLASLRTHGITNAGLEAVHARAKRFLEASDTRHVALAQAAINQSDSLSRRVAGPVRDIMNDLIQAIVMLLLLAIPFAFVMERLLLGATSIYSRLVGFAGLFVVTFALLYWMHPAFSIASTPIVVFLAFVIILLSSLVIYIIIRKFRTELAEIQGQGIGRHTIALSRVSTLIAAVNMGISTMRRRPLRSTLTAITVVILTFTILGFASFGTRVGVRTVYEGPLSDQVASSVFLRQLDYTKMSPDVLTLVDGYQGQGGLIAGQWWMTRQADDPPFGAASPTSGRSLPVDAIMGLDPDELARWPQLAEVLEGDGTDAKIAQLRGGGAYLPKVVQDQLGLKVGDEVLLAGVRVRLAGTFDTNRFQRLTHLDGRSVLPVDFYAVAAAAAASGAQPVDRTVQLEALVSKDYTRLSPNQVAVISSGLVRRLGGMLHLVTIYPAPEVDAGAAGRAIAEHLEMPVWARGPEGVDRLIFTRLTELSGGLALLVPVILGGLIVFGTMLGSITDRQKEIYSFSALGLAPTDVGFLFFSEAAVYAVVGGMMGQLLAQAAAMIASTLAQMGYIRPASINFSSTNALFAMSVVMATVLVSAIYPAIRASRSANPGLARSWKMPDPEGDVLTMTFPFTVSSYDITGVVSFLAEHFRQHEDAGLGCFASQDVRIGRAAGTGHLVLSARLVLAPFDLGVTQDFSLTAVPSEIPGVDEVAIRAERTSGAAADWRRAQRVFLQDLRKQFLLWRTLSAEVAESYRMQTLQALAGANEPASPTGAGSEGVS